MRFQGSRYLILLLLIGLLTPVSAAYSQKYVTVRPLRGDGIYSILRRYQLPANSYYMTEFTKLNRQLLSGDGELKLGSDYALPIFRYTFNGKTIRSTLGIGDYALAKQIQNYNEKMYRLGLKKNSYRVDKDLWVPFALHTTEPVEISNSFPIFGAKYQKVTQKGNELNGCVYYLDSGHGGPDPGAIGKRRNHELHEDEYAYDITLRLARNLIEHGATVYCIVQDPNDGIRDAAYLKGDAYEHYYGGAKISLNKKRRLQKRAEIINHLYRQNSSWAKKQTAVILHVDSRSNSKRIDIFYYYAKDNYYGKKIARTLYETIKRKYAEKQPGRGYTGTLSTRSLYMLREVNLPAVYLELGNIKNWRDQDRFIQANNRQAVANWLCEGLIIANTR